MKEDREGGKSGAGERGGWNTSSKMPANTKAGRAVALGRSDFGVCVLIDNRFVRRVVGGRGGPQGRGWRPVVRPDCRSAGRRPHVMPPMLLPDTAGAMHSGQCVTRPISVVRALSFPFSALADLLSSIRSR